MTSTHSEPHAGHGRRLYWAAIVALLLGLTALYHAVIRGEQPMRLEQDAEGRALVVLQRQRNSHFAATGAINGHEVNFLVDTGATDVAVSDQLARSIGLDFGPRIGIMTAGGPVSGWVTRLDTVQFGAFVLRDVRATITPGLGQQALLGMSFLKHFSIVQDGDTLVISAPGGSES